MEFPHDRRPNRLGSSHVGRAGAGMEGLVTVEPSADMCDVAGLLRGSPGRFLVAAGLERRLAGGRGRY